MESIRTCTYMWVPHPQSAPYVSTAISVIVFYTLVIVIVPSAGGWSSQNVPDDDLEIERNYVLGTKD